MDLERLTQATLAPDMFVKMAYLTILGRQVDEDGQRYWNERIDNKAFRKEDVLHELLYSREFTSRHAWMDDVANPPAEGHPAAEPPRRWINRIRNFGFSQLLPAKPAGVSLVPSEGFSPLHDHLRINDVRIGQLRLRLVDHQDSHVTECVRVELERDDYALERIPFADDDWVIDVGANIGTVSIYLAKRHPKTRIIAIEPIPQNFSNLVQNLWLNGVTNVVPLQTAITSDGRDVDFIMSCRNPGGATANLKDMQMPGHQFQRGPSTTLDRVFESFQIDRCRLLKIDCEGSEHEILHTAECLDRVEYISGEFHINQHLTDQGYSTEHLIDHCRQFVAPDKLNYTAIKMAE